nr:MAG: hypothetical protein [Bacteriophage sp.]
MLKKKEIKEAGTAANRFYEDICSTGHCKPLNFINKLKNTIDDDGLDLNLVMYSDSVVKILTVHVNDLINYRRLGPFLCEKP